MIRTTWHAWKLAYFPALEDTEAAEVLGEWARRHGVRWDLEEGRIEAAGKVRAVIRLTLSKE